jgi:hypothetical protein
LMAAQFLHPAFYSAGTRNALAAAP